MMWWEELMMNLTSGFYLCAVFGSLTVGAQVMPAYNGSSGSASTRMMSFNLLSTFVNAALEKATHPQRDDVEKQIAETEHDLKAMKRPLNAEEQRTAAQIRTWVIDARKALNVDDLEGAYTLSAKARALLVNLRKRSVETPHVLLIN
jgi:hypothetical protein